MQHYNDLYHSGVKGMKWGKRKNPVASVMNKISSSNNVSQFNDQYTKKNQRLDRKHLGPGGVKRINNRLNKGIPYNKAVKTERAVAVSKNIALGLVALDGVWGFPVARSLAGNGVKRGKQSVDNFMKTHQSESSYIKQAYDDFDKYGGVSKNTGYVIDDTPYKIL